MGLGSKFKVQGSKGSLQWAVAVGRIIGMGQSQFTKRTCLLLVVTAYFEKGSRFNQESSVAYSRTS